MNRKGSLVSDIAFYYLPYITHIITKYPSVKVICLKRNKELTINSYMKKTPGRNHWSAVHSYDTDPVWDITYPTYYEEDKRKAIGMYWDQYYNTITNLREKFPDNIGIFSMDETFNTEKGQLKLFNFIELETYQVRLNIKKNISK
jgi:hypothetical protein